MRTKGRSAEPLDHNHRPPIAVENSGCCFARNHADKRRKVMNDVVEVADSDQTQRVTQPALERSMLAAANSGDSPTKPAGCGCKHDLAPMEPPCAEAAIPPVQYVY